MPESPAYYTRGNIEVWDFIRDQQLPYHLGNAIKYVCRAGHKGSATKTQDLKKAIHYLENELQHKQSESETDGPIFGIPYTVWDSEYDGEPDYATGYDR